MIDKKTGRLDFCGHVGQFKLNSLEFGNLLSELFALEGISGGYFVGALGHSEGLSADRDAAMIERFHGDVETAADFTDPVGFGDFVIGENKFRSWRGFIAHFCFILADRETGFICFDYESDYPFGAVLSSGSGEDDDVIGDGALRYPEFGAVQDIAIAIFYSQKREGGGVGA